jgi:hypothetical protein
MIIKKQYRYVSKCVDFFLHRIPKETGFDNALQNLAIIV